ncbi:hypothetical protein FZC78_02190 [Rossellomorea vietnamensis]|uniref:Uncharacterized protein n=1 Tax=Rossellomorea vietnamensis TaxID=218284 RepID=A0A5D4P221_9BACI|nr:hypothetical protein [Rossellomorea vietnamensis]TYS19858.1 hypothetical protein FZC78_02190 [Rossellomorea vietnamensis]
MKLFKVLILITVITLAACSQENESNTDKEVTQEEVVTVMVNNKEIALNQPLKDWLSLEAKDKNELVIQVFEEKGLEFNKYRDYFRGIIKELDTAAADPATQNMELNKALDIQFENAQMFVNNQESSEQ